ncbi:MAG: amidohydrolase family protein [Ferruginibacter sp.]
MYRKFTADYLFTGHEILAEPAVLVTDTSGKIIELVNHSDAGEGIEKFTGLLTPGFINAHCHLELSHLKGAIPEKTGLVDFVQQVMAVRSSSTEKKLTSMEVAATEMYDSGIVAVGDICNTRDTIPVKQRHNLLWHNFIEVSGFTDASAEDRLNQMRKVHSEFQGVNQLREISFCPHAPYSVSKCLFNLLNNETAGQVTTIHNQESLAESDLYRYKKGDFLTLYKKFGIDINAFEPTRKSSFQSWKPYFRMDQTIIAVHNTYMEQEDLDFDHHFQPGKSSRMFYCLCINANKYIEQKIPPITLLRKNRCNIVLGTDSLASNHQLNILEEIKTIQRETGLGIPLSELLQWATINGAIALNLGDRTGSFERGKRPGIVLIEGLDN